MGQANQKARRARVPGALNTGVYRRADGRLEIGWKDATGKQRWRTLEAGATIPDARAAFGAERARAASGERVADKPRMTFAYAAEAWLESKANLRPTTRAKYRSHLDTHVLPAFGAKRLTAITPDDVARYAAAKKREGCKASSVHAHLGVMASVFKYAIRRLGHAGTNPVMALERDERPRISDDQSEKRILNPAELSRLLAAVPERHRLIFDVAASTGLRLGETLGLVWGDVDTNAETLSLTHQLDRQGERVPLKTKRSRRTVEITPSLAAKLREAKVAARKSGKHDLVFVTSADTGHDHRNIGGRVLARAVKAAGLEAIERDGVVIEPAPTFHDLRHTHASALIAAGENVELVSRRLGHADASTTLRVYVHQFDAAKRTEAFRSRLAAMEANLEAEGCGTVAEDQASNVVKLPHQAA